LAFPERVENGADCGTWIDFGFGVLIGHKSLFTNGERTLLVNTLDATKF